MKYLCGAVAVAACATATLGMVWLSVEYDSSFAAVGSVCMGLVTLLAVGRVP